MEGHEPRGYAPRRGGPDRTAMDILIVSDEHVRKSERYMDNKGWSFGKAFEKLGVATETFFYKKKGKLSFLEKDKHIKKQWLHYINRQLTALVKKKKPDVMLIVKGETIGPETLWEIRKKTGTLIINVFPDNPFYMGNIEAIEPCHLFFVKDSYVLDTLRKSGLKNVHYLPQCTDLDVHRPMALEGKDREKYESDLTLIGSMYPYRHRMVEELLEFRPSLWGRGWSRSPNGKIRELYNGADIRGSSKAKAISGTSISLNPHHPLNDINGVNRRTYDIAACGGFQLADCKGDMEGLLKVGEEIICFKSVRELKKQIKYYLRRPEERAEIARAAYKRVIREHTYDRRAEEILELIRAGL
jgi:spore maturation protein CgeB